MTGNKMKTIIIAILIGAILIACVTGAWYYKTQFFIPDKDGMVRDMAHTITSCSYSTGGGMEGGSMSLTISIKENGEVWLDYYNCPFIGADEEIISHQVPQEAIEEIQVACSERKVFTWGDLPYSDMQILDAPTTTISFVYGDNEYYSVNSNRDLPKKGEGFFAEIYTIMKKYK